MIVVTVARRPLVEKNVADQVLSTGTGALNLRDTRVGDEQLPAPAKRVRTSLPGDERTAKGQGMFAPGTAYEGPPPPPGRWPRPEPREGGRPAP